MKTGHGARALIVVAMTSIPLGAIPLVAQEPGAEKKAVGKGYDAVRRVPPYFAKVGLSAEQREEIYKIRSKHLEQIEVLKQQIQRHETQMLTESEAVLTDAQRRLLEQYRTESKGKTKEKSKAKAKDSTKPGGSPPDAVK